MGLSPVSTFDDISENTELTYGDVDKIDLWIGGLAETPLTQNGSQLGELFSAIIVRQFTELRDGYRFWYENYLTASELERIEDITLAQVIRNNTNIGNELQDNVFFVL